MIIIVMMIIIINREPREAEALSVSKTVFLLKRIVCMNIFGTAKSQCLRRFKEKG